MKPQVLKYFCVLAEELHFGRAANRLAISQPPLSTAIRALEDELGVQLFVRNSKMVRLTPAGAVFRIEAQEVLERLARMKSVVRAVDAGLHGRLEIGMTSSLLYRDMTIVLSEFRREVPAVELVLHEMSTSEQIEKLMRRQIHAAFVQTSVVPAPLQAVPLRLDYFVVCLPEGHRLANEESIDLRELADERFIMFSRDSAPASHDHVIGVFSRADMHPEIVHAARTWLTIVAMVAQGYGVALVPESMARSGVSGTRFARLEGAQSPVPASLVWNPTGMLDALESFLECSIRTIQRLKTQGTAVSKRAKRATLTT